MRVAPYQLLQTQLCSPRSISLVLGSQWLNHCQYYLLHHSHSPTSAMPTLFRKPATIMPISVHQHDWSSPVFKTAQQSLLRSPMDAQDKTRLLVVAEKETESWLEALPVPSLCLHLSNDKLRIIASLHLGVPICTEYTCVCNESVWILSTHVLKCKISKRRWFCHQSRGCHLCVTTPDRTL